MQIVLTVGSDVDSHIVEKRDGTGPVPSGNKVKEGELARDPDAACDQNVIKHLNP